MKIILKNNIEIQLDEATYDGHYVINFESVAAYKTVWDSFTTENLEDFSLVNDEGDTVNRILNLRLLSTQAIINPDDTVTGHFYFGGGSVVSNEYEQAGRILLGEEE